MSVGNPYIGKVAIGVMIGFMILLFLLSVERLLVDADQTECELRFELSVAAADSLDVVRRHPKCADQLAEGDAS